MIELIASAQCEDGYLNAYFTVKAPEERWSNLAECHELYCAGHLIEAGVAFFQATGKRRLLEVVCRLVPIISTAYLVRVKVSYTVIPVTRKLNWH